MIAVVFASLGGGLGTVRSLADESFNVVLIEDCCAAGTDELHRKELEILNMIYCHVVSCGELRDILAPG